MSYRREGPMLYLLCCAFVFGDDLSRSMVRDDNAMALLQLRHSEQDAMHSHGSTAESCMVDGVPNFHLIHIPKTAGTSFRLDFDLEQNGALHGAREHCLPPHHHAGCTVVFFRSPRAHVMSQFVQCIDPHVYPPNKTLIKEGLEFPLPENIRSDLRSGFPLWLDHFASPSGQSVCPDKDSGLPAHAHCRTGVDFNCYNPNNMQTRHLVCTREELWGAHYIGPEGAVPDVAQALTNLESVDFLGITELYTASVCVMKTKLTGMIADGCGCEAESTVLNLHHDDHHDARHANPGIATFAADENVLQKIDTITQADQTIYETALERFVTELREIEDSHKVKLLCDDDKEKLRDEIRYIPGLVDRLGI